MPNTDSGEKTEKATPYRRRKAREQGQVAKSIDVNTAAVMLFFLLLIYFSGQYFGGFFFRNFLYLLENSAELSPFKAGADVFVIYIKSFLLIVVLLMIVGIAANVGQFGFIFTLQPLKPDLNKLNPVEGIKRLFSLKTIFEAFKGVLKVTVVGIVIYLILKSDFSKFVASVYSEPMATLVFIVKECMKLLMYAVLLYILIAAVDFAYQKWEYEKKLRMTKQEVKEEYKQREGRPEVKAAIRRRQREIAMRRMMQEVPQADVVITNPTHYAVALKYEPEKRDAPYVVAKGVDNVAKKIIEIAKENDVPIVEKPEIARELYRLVDIDEEIPEKLYKAVAEILAFVFRMKNRTLI